MIPFNKKKLIRSIFDYGESKPDFKIVNFVKSFHADSWVYDLELLTTLKRMVEH